MVRTRRSRAVAAALCLCLLAGNGGGIFICNDVFDEFRVAASDDLEAGVNRIFDGLIAGAFALFEPDADTDAANP